MNSQTLNHSFSLLGLSQVMTAHGIRFLGRTWLTENNYPFDIGEIILSHQISNSTARAYYRTDMIDKRRDIQEDWTQYILSCDKDNLIKNVLNS